MASPEYTTMIHCTDLLTTGLAGNPLGIATKLQGKGFVAPSTTNEMELPTTKQSKAARLVMCVTDQIKINPGRFVEFVTILQSEIWLEETVKKLLETYESLGGTLFSSTNIKPLTSPQTQDVDGKEVERLNMSNLQEVRSLIFDVRCKWHDLGIELGVRIPDLETIKENCVGDPEKCFRELLIKWLKAVNPVPTWRALVTALKSKAVDELLLATQVANTYGLQEMVECVDTDERHDCDHGNQSTAFISESYSNHEDEDEDTEFEHYVHVDVPTPELPTQRTHVLTDQSKSFPSVCDEGPRIRHVAQLSQDNVSLKQPETATTDKTLPTQTKPHSAAMTGYIRHPVIVLMFCGITIVVFIGVASLCQQYFGITQTHSSKPQKMEMEMESGHENSRPPAISLSTYQPRAIKAQRRKYNVEIKENHGLNGATGFWWLYFTFDYALEKGIEVRLTNFKHSGRSDWTLKVTKCHYLGIVTEDDMASFDLVDEFVNSAELARLNECVTSNEKLYQYLETNVIPIVTRKIKYTKYKPQFRFFLSHKTRDKPLMRTFENGLRFLGYDTWLDTVNMPMGANLTGALKTAIDSSDCLIAWLTKEYFKSEYCTSELLYAHTQGKIIVPFGVHSEIKEFFTGEMAFLTQQVVFDPKAGSFFEVLRRIDETLFDFEYLPL